MAKFTLGGAAAASSSASKFSTGLNAFGVKRVILPKVPVDVDETSGLAVFEIEGNSDKNLGPITKSRYYAMLSGVVSSKTFTDSRGEDYSAKFIEVKCALKGTNAEGGTFGISLRLSDESTLVEGEEIEPTTLVKIPSLNPLTGKINNYFDASVKQK